MRLFELILVIFCFFELCLAGLDHYSCSEPVLFGMDVGLCSTKKDAYVKPFPVVVETTLHVRAINAINEDKNSISLQVGLYCSWKDPNIVVASNVSTG